MAQSRRGTIWSNVKWIHPVRTEYGTGTKALKEKLRYFTYRNDRDAEAPVGGRRWIDRGLGSSHKEILESCQALTSQDRLAWTLMISPKPRLLALIEDEQQRTTFMQSLTEDVIDQWFEARSYYVAQYAYVLHDRSTSEEGFSQLHTHIVLPGTVETAAGRERFDNRPSDLRQFNELVENVFEQHMDRQLGFTWRDQWAAMQREEALKKHFQQLQIENMPANLPELATRLHTQGLDTAAIPSHITDQAAFEEWLTEMETRGADLDHWFGGGTR